MQPPVQRTELLLDFSAAEYALASSPRELRLRLRQTLKTLRRPFDDDISNQHSREHGQNDRHPEHPPPQTITALAESVDTVAQPPVRPASKFGQAYLQPFLLHKIVHATADLSLDVAHCPDIIVGLPGPPVRDPRLRFGFGLDISSWNILRCHWNLLRRL